MSTLSQVAGALAQATDGAGSGTAEFWVFWIVAPVALGSALGVVLLRNAVHAALMLVVNLFMIAVLYAVLEAQFLAVAQIIVYAGAIMVLFLFVLMLLGVHRDEPPAATQQRGQRPAGVLLGVALLIALSGAVAGPYLGDGSVCPPAEAPAEAAGLACRGLATANEAGNVQGVGALLFTDYVWPFEVTSLLLVIAAIGAIVLGRRSEDPADLVDRPVTAASPSAGGGSEGPSGGRGRLGAPEAASPSAGGGSEGPSGGRGRLGAPEAASPSRRDPE